MNVLTIILLFVCSGLSIAFTIAYWMSVYWKSMFEIVREDRACLSAKYDILLKLNENQAGLIEIVQKLNIKQKKRMKALESGIDNSVVWDCKLCESYNPSKERERQT